MSCTFYCGSSCCLARRPRLCQSPFSLVSCWQKCSVCILPENGSTGFSCEYITALGAYKGAGGPKELVPVASGLATCPPCTALPAVSAHGERTGHITQGGFCRDKHSSWGTCCFGKLGDREVSKQIPSRFCSVLMLQKTVLKTPRSSNSIKMF